MKKIIAILSALVMVFAVAAFAFAETAAPALPGGVAFDMDMDQVMQIVNRKNYKIDNEDDRGTPGFWEIEYEDLSLVGNLKSDVNFLFIGNGLVAIHFEMADSVSYDQARAEFTKLYGEAVAFDASNLGNGRFAIDDDGHLNNCKEMIVNGNVLVVFEQEHADDVDVTILDMNAAYINN